MNLSLTPICLARFVAERTNNSPPPTRPASPTIVRIIATGRLLSVFPPSAKASGSEERKDQNMYAAKTARNMIPSHRARESATPIPNKDRLIPNTSRRTVTKSVSGMSRLRLASVIATGTMSDVSPRINKVLNMLEPITLPTAISALPWKAPVKLTTSSGQDVPKPTIVRPITNSLTPAFRAIPEAPSTSQSAPRTISPRPTSSNIIVINDVLR